KEVLEHRFKTELETFSGIKKGDYIEWIVIEKGSAENNKSLKVSRILGRLEKEFEDSYKLIENIGHSLLISVIDKKITYRESTDYLTLSEMKNINSDYYQS